MIFASVSHCFYLQVSIDQRLHTPVPVLAPLSSLWEIYGIYIAEEQSVGRQRKVMMRLSCMWPRLRETPGTSFRFCLDTGICVKKAAELLKEGSYEGPFYHSCQHALKTRYIAKGSNSHISCCTGLARSLSSSFKWLRLYLISANGFNAT